MGDRVEKIDFFTYAQKGPKSGNMHILTHNMVFLRDLRDFFRFSSCEWTEIHLIYMPPAKKVENLIYRVNGIDKALINQKDGYTM